MDNLSISFIITDKSWNYIPFLNFSAKVSVLFYYYDTHLGKRQPKKSSVKQLPSYTKTDAFFLLAQNRDRMYNMVKLVYKGKQAANPGDWAWEEKYVFINDPEKGND